MSESRHSYSYPDGGYQHSHSHNVTSIAAFLLATGLLLMPIGAAAYAEVTDGGDSADWLGKPLPPVDAAYVHVPDLLFNEGSHLVCSGVSDIDPVDENHTVLKLTLQDGHSSCHIKNMDEEVSW